MSTRVSNGTTHDMSDIRPGILFTGSCIGLIATSVGFAVTGEIMGALKAQFLLSNSQAGWLMGAGGIGFTVSILVFGPLVDFLGMRLQLRMAFLGHLLGALVFMSATFFRQAPATAFWVLMAGTLILAIANGLIEAVCNPLVATIYPDRKTQKLNQFHVWFPGGIFIGGVTCYLMNVLSDATGAAWVSAWQLKLCLIVVPTLIYGALFAGQRFPFTERVQSGLSFGQMVSSTLFRPLFIILALCMCITASIELGPGRWMPSVFGAVGISGILMLAWQNGLMAVMRYFAGHVVERLRPSGMLVASAIIGGLGLYLLSYADNKYTAFAAVTVFAIGVCYFWPTMLGVASERVPKGGALALALLGGIGNLAVGFVTTPAMGIIADSYIEANLPVQQAQATLRLVEEAYPAPGLDEKPNQYSDTEKAHADAVAALAGLSSEKPEGKAILSAAAALRSAADAVPVALNPKKAHEIRGVAEKAKAIIGPADNMGGRKSFRFLAPFALILVVVFGTIYLRDHARGGYRVERIGGTPKSPVTPE